VRCSLWALRFWQSVGRRSKLSPSPFPPSHRRTKLQYLLLSNQPPLGSVCCRPQPPYPTQRKHPKPPTLIAWLALADHSLGGELPSLSERRPRCLPACACCPGGCCDAASHLPRPYFTFRPPCTNRATGTAVLPSPHHLHHPLHPLHPLTSTFQGIQPPH